MDVKELREDQKRLLKFYRSSNRNKKNKIIIFLLNKIRRFKEVILT